MHYEVGQLLHNNPVGCTTPNYVDALIVAIRDEIARVYWNVNQKQWGFSGDAQWDEAWGWSTPDLPENGTGIPGVAWRAYYNWGGSPDDDDWDQEKANLPNFSFDGVEIRWYKRFGRSMNVNVRWGPAEWVAWFDRCLDALCVYEFRRECHAREEAIDNGGACRRCPKCDRYYVTLSKPGRCGWDGADLVAVCLTAEDKADIKRRQDEWRAKRTHGLPEGYEVVESVVLARGWKAMLVRHESLFAGMFGKKGPHLKDAWSALLCYPCGCICGSHGDEEKACRERLREYVEDQMNEKEAEHHEKRHEEGPF